jgi:hypothetical protein
MQRLLTDVFGVHHVWWCVLQVRSTSAATRQSSGSTRQLARASPRIHQDAWTPLSQWILQWIYCLLQLEDQAAGKIFRASPIFHRALTLSMRLHYCSGPCRGAIACCSLKTCRSPSGLNPCVRWLGKVGTLKVWLGGVGLEYGRYMDPAVRQLAQVAPTQGATPGFHLVLVLVVVMGCS